MHFWKNENTFPETIWSPLVFRIEWSIFIYKNKIISHDKVESDTQVFQTVNRKH